MYNILIFIYITFHITEAFQNFHVMEDGHLPSVLKLKFLSISQLIKPFVIVRRLDSSLLSMTN